MSSFNGSDFLPDELESLSVWQLPDVDGKTRQQRLAEQQKEQASSRPHLTVTEIEAMQKQAYDEGFEQGKADGFTQGFNQGKEEGSQRGYQENLDKINAQLTQFEALMTALSEPLKQLDNEVEQELIDLIIGVAKQIIRREIKLDAGQVVAAVREAIKVLPLASQKINLSLHPEDAELVRSALSLDEMTTPWVIVEDPLITRGGCRVGTDVSQVNATIEHRLAAVVAATFGSERGRDRDL